LDSRIWVAEICWSLDFHIWTGNLECARCSNAQDALVTATVEVDDVERTTFSLVSTPEWRSVCTWRHSILLEGSRISTEAVLLLLGPSLRDPVAWRRPGTLFQIPRDTSGAFIVQDIADLSRAEQGRLLMWMNESSRPKQVVSTTTNPLFPLVARGQFDETLYYRLNVVLLRVDASSLDVPAGGPLTVPFADQQASL
jgi:hypothetical protein